MKVFLFITFFLLSLNASHLDSNTTLIDNISSEETVVHEDENLTKNDKKLPTGKVIVVHDESGLSDDEVREKAKDSDVSKVSKIQLDFSEVSPNPLKYDWVKTKSGEWFKGEIKALYDNKLEFDSDEVGLYTFDFDDVVWVKSYHIISVNIENLASFPGILRIKGDEVKVIQGENTYDFKRKDIVSFAPNGEYERNFWSGKATISIDIRSGNTNQYDYSAKVNVQRRTSESRLILDYLGRITTKDNQETANDHRLNQKYDRYLTRHFFWTPVFSEIYSDIFKNIKEQVTLGFGLGYTLVDTKKVTWSFSGGPAFVYTKYNTISEGSDIDDFSPALELSTRYENELSKITDFTATYKLTYTNEAAGTYKHHMLITFENELTSRLDLDITGIWDYILDPKETSDKIIANPNDFQLLVGIGMEF